MAAVLSQKAAAKAELRGKAAEMYAKEADALASNGENEAAALKHTGNAARRGHGEGAHPVRLGSTSGRRPPLGQSRTTDVSYTGANRLKPRKEPAQLPTLIPMEFWI